LPEYLGVIELREESIDNCRGAGSNCNKPLSFLFEETSMIRCRFVLLATIGLSMAILSYSHGGDAKPGFHRYVSKDADGKEAPYHVFVPQDYKGDKAYPLIVFLHGAGETNNEKRLLEVGLPPAVKKKAKTFPFLVMVPMALTKGWGAEGPNAKRALAQLEEVKKNYKVDDKRIYLTGLSMGGFGTWSLAAAYPERWAAIAPICGGGNTKSAAKIKDIPCWCFHGDADTAVKVDQSRNMIKALKDAGGNPKYDEYKGVGHNSWDRAYATAELFTWLLQHKSK
jgi:predicted peptidase